MTIRRTNIRTQVKQEQAEAAEAALAQQTAQPATPEQNIPTAVPASPAQVPVEGAESPQEPEPTPEIVRSHVVISLPAQPIARRITRKVPFNDQYEKRTIMLDRRITPYFDHLLESGPTKTVMANQYILKLLIDVGYQIDPDILDQPFKKPKKRT